MGRKKTFSQILNERQKPRSSEPNADRQFRSMLLKKSDVGEDRERA
jgi:hypothetical protein